LTRSFLNLQKDGTTEPQQSTNPAARLIVQVTSGSPTPIVSSFYFHLPVLPLLSNNNQQQQLISQPTNHPYTPSMQEQQVRRECTSPFEAIQGHALPLIEQTD